MENSGNDLIGTKEAADILGVSLTTVQRYCREKRFGRDAMQDAPNHPWHIRKDAVLRMKKQREMRRKK